MNWCEVISRAIDYIENKVLLVIDKELSNNLLFHHNVNTKTMSVSYDDLIKFIEYEKHEYISL